MKVRGIAIALISMLALSGCYDEIRDTLAPLSPALKNGEGAAAQRISGPVVDERPPPPNAVVAPGRRTGTSGRAPTATGTGQVTMNFVDTDVREIARTVLGNLLKVTYTIDPAVHGTGTIQTASPVSREQALELLETVLSQNGAALTVGDGIYRVSGNTGVPAASLVGSDKVGAGTRVLTLRYASAADLAAVLEPFATPGSKITADPTRNVLIISGDAVTRNSLEEVARAFDTDMLAGKSFALFPVVSGDPEKVGGELNKALMTGDKGALANLVRIVPMDRVNAVLVITSQPRYIDEVRRIFSLVDRVSAQTVRTWHVYYVRNGQSSDLENVLQRAFTPDNVTSSGSQSDTKRLGGSTVPGLTLGSSTSIGGGGGGGGGDLSSGQGAGIGGGGSSTVMAQTTTAANQPPVANAATAPLLDALSAGGGDKAPTKDSIRVIANKTNNALLIYATGQEYRNIEAMLNKIDILPLQVEIDAVIAEVDLTDQLQYGVQFFFHNGGLSGILSQNAGGLPLSANFPGFVLEKASNAVQYTLSALQSVSKVRVLSSPQITVLDNETATLEVGDQVPYLTQSATILSGTSTAGAPIVNSIAYQKTGVILQVAPRVNSGGLVTLDIAQEVSQPVTTTSSTIGSPTFADRAVKSRVVVHDGQTIGLAGLISDNDSRVNGGLPYLKDVPIVGSLLGNQNNMRTRTELLVLLTPHVDYDQREVQNLTEDLRRSLSGAALVPRQLNSLKPTGSADPNIRFRGEH